MKKKNIIPNFDMEKLPVQVEELTNKKVLFAGVGAVGSHAASAIAQRGIVRLTLVDKDRFETANIAKSSFTYDPTEDDGKNKAIALASRINHCLGADLVHGIDTDIANLGPMALAGYDVIILALDNYGAKVLANHNWLQIPSDKRPLLIFGGTSGSSAQCNCLDGREACIRCYFDESWLDNPFEKYSCKAINYGGTVSIFSEKDRNTTGGASMMSAAWIAEDCEGYLLGHKKMINRRTFYNSYPNQGLFKYQQLERKNCPDCKNYHSIENAVGLSNTDVLHTTVGNLLDILKELLLDDSFEILPQTYEPGKVIYNKIIKDDYCRCCGRELKHLYRHEYKTKISDLICKECMDRGCKPDDKYINLAGSFIGGIDFNNCDSDLREKPLFEVGFPIGAIIKVRHEEGEDILGSTYTYYYFYCENDPELLNYIDRLEG